MIFSFGVLAIYVKPPGQDSTSTLNADFFSKYPTFFGVLFSLAGPLFLSAGALLLALGFCLPRRTGGQMNGAGSRRGTAAGITPTHSTENLEKIKF